MRTITALFVILALASCKDEKVKHSFPYSTKSDSAIYFYQLAWKQIMDEGRYSQSEITWRKSLEFDPDFQLAKSCLARITSDPEERAQLFAELNQSKNQLQGEERKILDVYLAFLELYIIRDRGPVDDELHAALYNNYKLAENHLRSVTKRYPDEIYLQAEYLEILNANYADANRVLDSIQNILTKRQRNNPFIKGFTASLKADLGDYKSALRLARDLEDDLGLDLPKTHAVFADLYFKMGEWDLATKYVERALELDSGNLDAQRTSSEIRFAIEELEESAP